MQFNWIFILIAGALILSFFVMIAQKQLILSEKKQELNTWQQFDNVFSSALKTEETSFTIDTKAKISFFCTENQCSFKIGDNFQKYSLPIFAPSILDGGPLTLWSKSFNSPFYVTNLLLITNPKIRFVFVSSNNDPLKIYLEKNLPESVNVEFVNSAKKIVYQGHDHVRFVFLNTNKETLDRSFDNAPYSIVLVANNQVFLEGKTYPFSEEHKELLLAALFSQDSNMYETQLKNKIFNRIKDISSILKQKASVNSDLICYADLSIFDNLSNTAQELNKEFNQQNFNKLTSYETEIEKAQQNCPKIY